MKNNTKLIEQLEELKNSIDTNSVEGYRIWGELALLILEHKYTN